jgi:hypothetical protein
MKMSTHHTKPRSLGGKRKHCVEIPDKAHRAWHIIVGNKDIFAIVETLNRWFIDNEYTLIIMPRSAPKENHKQLKIHFP